MLVIRDWLALPYSFKGLTENRPAMEVLLDPKPIQGMGFIDNRIELAIRRDEHVLVYATPDSRRPVECPMHLIGQIPDEAWNRVF